MPPAADPQPEQSLFPAHWVVGPAAAELARNDTGVLLAESGQDGAGRVAGGQRSSRSAADVAFSLAEIRAEMARLESQFATAARRRKAILRERAGTRPAQPGGAALHPLEHLYPDGVPPVRIAALRRHLRRRHVLAQSGDPGERRRTAMRVALLAVALVGVGAFAWRADLATTPFADTREVVGTWTAAVRQRVHDAVGESRALWLGVQQDLADRLGQLRAHSSVTPAQAPAISEAGMAAPVAASSWGGLGGAAQLRPAAWWRSEGLDRFTIQVVVSPREPELLEFARRHRWALFGPLGRIREPAGNGEVFGLLYGSYASAALARKVLAALPPDMQAARPQVRRLGDIHDALY